MINGKLKIAVIGGGSSYTPELIEGIAARRESLPVGELWLVDVDMGREKVQIIAGLAERMLKKAGSDIAVHVTFDRREAIEHADFVLTQFRVGGLEARAKDESIPLKYDIIGQETTGPGGYCKALRTVPVILDICREIEQYSDNAWLINFTNPSGIVSEAILNHTNVRAMGLCNIPICVKRDVAKELGVEASRVDAEFIGLNHMSFVSKIYLDGRDILPQLLLDDTRLTDALKRLSDRAWDLDFIRHLGMLPNPYHRYYFGNAAMLAQEKADFAANGSRAMQVMEIERKLFEQYADLQLDIKPPELAQRGGAYYSEAAISLIDAIHNDRGEIHTVNIRNQGAMEILPDDAVIEVNAVIGKDGAKPIPVGSIPTIAAGLIRNVKAYETLAVEAAVNKDYDTALAAMLANPFLNDIDTARAMLDEMIEAHGEYLAYLKKESV